MKQINDVVFTSLYERYKSFLQKKNIEQESPFVDIFNVFVKFDKYFQG